jgi:hypothetical protein
MSTAHRYRSRRARALAWGVAGLLAATTASTSPALAEAAAAKPASKTKPQTRPRPATRPSSPALPGDADSLAGPGGDAARSFVTPLLSNWVIRDADGHASASEIATLRVINPDVSKSVFVRVTCHDLSDGSTKKMKATVAALDAHGFKPKFASEMPRAYWCHIEAAHPIFAHASIQVVGKHTGEGSYHPVVPLFVAKR